MRFLSLFAALSATLILAACEQEAVKDDPVRAEFLPACEGMAAYGSMEPKKRTAHCACVYDKTMSGLSDEEKQVARFYLLEQAGLDAQSRNLVNESNLQAIGKAANSIGEAVKRCG